EGRSVVLSLRACFCAEGELRSPLRDQVELCSRTTPTVTSSSPPRSTSRRSWSALTVAVSPSNGPCASTSPVWGSTAMTPYPSHGVSFSAAAPTVASSEVVFSGTRSPPSHPVQRRRGSPRDRVRAIPPVRVRVNLRLDHPLCCRGHRGHGSPCLRVVSVTEQVLSVIIGGRGGPGVLSVV